MILPGTLVQCVRADAPLRIMAIYTVADAWAIDRPTHCSGCLRHHTGTALLLCEVDLPALSPRGATPIGWCLEAFRIIAAPITEADRLEASAPTGGVKLKPAKTTTTPASHSQMTAKHSGASQ